MTAPVPAVEISAVMPAYNEEANLEQSVGRMATALQTFTRGFEIIVVDDGSQDGTPAVLERLKAAHPNLRVIRHPVNRGYGAALRSGFGAARFSWIFLMDADNPFDPAEVELLHARVVEVPVHHYPRKAGKQTGANIRVVIRAFAELLVFRAEMRKVERAA